MQVKDLNKILERCGFGADLYEKPINSNHSSEIFLQMARNATDKVDLINAIRYLAIAIYLLENGQ